MPGGWAFTLYQSVVNYDSLFEHFIGMFTTFEQYIGTRLRTIMRSSKRNLVQILTRSMTKAKDPPPTTYLKFSVNCGNFSVNVVKFQ